MLSIGVLRLLVDVGVFARDQFARWTGVVALSDAAIDALCEDMRHMGVSTRLGE